jgi:tRNA U55 pseudouridine synthase TruB
MYMQRTTSGAAGNGLYTTIKYMCGASGTGMGTTIKHLRRTTSGAARNGLGATMKYLRRTTSAAANNGMSITVTPLCSAASFEVNSEPHTVARPSVRLCVGPKLARCVHNIIMFGNPPKK